MSDQYYIRIRGEVKGPLTREQITAQIRRKRLGRHHELSTDAITWQKAGDMPEFFQPAIAPRERNVEVEIETVEADKDQPVQHSEPDVDAAVAGEEWYYSKGGNKLGPVSASDIQMWLSSGRLSASDLVWNEGFDNWLPAGELPQFASAAGAGGKKSSASGDMQPAGFWEVFMGTSRAATLPEDAIHKYPNLTRYLRIAEAAIRITFVLALFLNFAGWIYLVGRAVNDEQWELVAGGLIAGPLQVMLLWLIFITGMAGLEFIRVVIKIEDNTA
ncbi:MAG: GYF domain-containing protein [Planctomycetaceae bacterium]